MGNQTNEDHASGVFDRIEGSRQYFADHAVDAERLGRLPDETAQRLKDIGVVRMLQPPEHGGFACHPCDFFEAVMSIAAADPAAGWISGVVGVHPWEMVFNHPKLQAEVWGEDPNTWVASPYAPMGTAKPVDGGYRFSGRWPFSSGTDNCAWVVLGGFIEGRTDHNGMPKMYHLFLPRSDYTIDHDSWDTLGLRGTGSKDVVVDDAFVPEHRILSFTEVLDGTAARHLDHDDPLFRMPWSAVFPHGITAAMIGISLGALEAHVEYQKARVSFGQRTSRDPFQMAAIGEAASEIHASRSQMLWNVSRMYDKVSKGQEITLEERAAGRRDQVRAGWRAVAAVDEIFTRTGGNATRSTSRITKIYRDLHTGLNHAIFTSGPTYQASANTMMGDDPQNIVRLLI